MTLVERVAPPIIEPGVYRDKDGDLWAVTADDKALLLTDVSTAWELRDEGWTGVLSDGDLASPRSVIEAVRFHGPLHPIIHTSKEPRS